MIFKNVQTAKAGTRCFKDVSFKNGMDSRLLCPSCNSQGLMTFYSVDDVPVHSCLLVAERSEALKYRRGDLALAFCKSCGLICNYKYEPDFMEYSTDYEETQFFSSCFNAFAKSLAERLVDTYDLHNKNILEIGCGGGEFLTTLCRLGNNRGIGFDPAYNPGRAGDEDSVNVRFIKDLYSEKYSHLRADFICCRHTLEHIDQTGQFLRILRDAIGSREETIVFFEVPDVGRVLSQGAFWDIYYEHCSYFSESSLAMLFSMSGFEIIQTSLDYDGQYLMITAAPCIKRHNGRGINWDDGLERLFNTIENFANICSSKLTSWRNVIECLIAENQRVVLWGSGSKAVGFLTTLGLNDHIQYVVDINPNKQGMYMPGCGQRIVSPKFLIDYRPSHVIVMNSIYRQEIQNELNKLGIKAELMCL